MKRKIYIYQKLCQKKFVYLIEVNNFAFLRFLRISHIMVKNQARSASVMMRMCSLRLIEPWINWLNVIRLIFFIKFDIFPHIAKPSQLINFSGNLNVFTDYIGVSVGIDTYSTDSQIFSIRFGITAKPIFSEFSLKRSFYWLCYISQIFRKMTCKLKYSFYMNELMSNLITWPDWYMTLINVWYFASGINNNSIRADQESMSDCSQSYFTGKLKPHKLTFAQIILNLFTYRSVSNCVLNHLHSLLSRFLNWRKKVRLER